MTIKPKKSLGQNFLIDQNIINKISSLTKINNKIVLEIGAGTGNLSSGILKQSPKKFFAIEKDKELFLNLKKQFKDKIILINNDILEFDEYSLSKDKLTVFGNLPYNISTEILSKWIINLKDDNFWFDSLTLMFQKEVANRILAKSNTSTYGRLTVLANWKLDIEKICDISPSCFSPRPKVESSLLFFKPKKYFPKLKNSKNLEIITRTFFNQRRKMIKKPYNQLFNGDKNILEKLNLNLNLRPQNLKLTDYYKIASEYEKLRC